MADKKREHWSGSLGFILAAAGSAIGLGNIWKFPYITGENGGGAFVLVYLLCIIVIGLPVMLCEITIGRKTQRNPVGAFKALAPRNSVLAHLIGASLALSGLFLLVFAQYGWSVVMLMLGSAVFRYGWRVVGGMGVIAGFVILAFYSVVAGWTIGYLVKSLPYIADMTLGAVNIETPDAVEASFVGFAGDWRASITCHFAFMLVCVLIVVKGIKGGIERWSKILMPILFLLLIVLILRSVSLPGADAGIRFLLSPDFGKLSAESVLIALGHAFFTLSLGMGAIITYGSYVDKKQNLFTASLAIVALDTLIALMAGLAIFPAVFATGLEPGAGPGLVFMVLPRVFGQIPGGWFWQILFFLLVLVAAITSGISLLEVVTAYFVDERKWTRRMATWIFGGVIFLLGVPCALSPDKGINGWKYLGGVKEFLELGFGSVPGCFFDVLEKLADSYMLPLGGVFIAIFVGWIWGTDKAVKEIRKGSHNFADVHLFSLMAGLKDDSSHNSDVHVLTLASLWGFFIRFITPVAVAIAFMHTIGWISFKEEPEPPAAETVQVADDSGAAGMESAHGSNPQ